MFSYHLNKESVLYSSSLTGHSIKADTPDTPVLQYLVVNTLSPRIKSSLFISVVNEDSLVASNSGNTNSY